jgi:hypothetical protein
MSDRRWREALRPSVQERVTYVDVIVGYQNSIQDDITIQFDSTVTVLGRFF